MASSIESRRWIVEDDQPVASGQMRKSEFVRLALETLMGNLPAADGRPLSNENCPSFAFWGRFYANQSAAHVERAIRSFIGGNAAIHSAEE